MFDAEFWRSDEMVGFLSAFGLSALYIIAGYLTARFANRKEDISSFIFVVIAGMAVRVVLTLIAVGYLLAVVGVHAKIFCVTFFISYFIFLMAEILYINHRYNAFVRRKREKIIEEREAIRSI